jgi:TolB-like protein
MLSGRRAFRGDSAVETMSAILKEEPAAISAARPDIPPAFERIVRRCLEKAADQRFQSARDLAFALSETVSSPAAPPSSRERPPSRGKLLFAAAAGILAVGAVALFLAVRAGDTSARALARAGHPIASLAVLPLQNLSKDPEQEYFSDGMTDELITKLARIGALRVISRTSVMSYKGTKKPLTAFARELGVDAVIEGSVLRSGDKVRITAQLIHGATDRHLWAESYQRDLRDVLSMQSEVALAIAGEIAAKLTPQEEKRLAAARPVTPEAHELYLKGRYELNKQTEASLRKAIDDFRKAIEKDPGFAPAYAGLADSYSFLRSTYAAPKDVMPQAREAARRALELDDTLAEAHVSMGLTLFFYDFDWAGAEKELKRAIELNPNLADAHDAYATFLAGMNRSAEAVAEIERARRLDPLSLLILSDAAWVYYCVRQYDRAIEESRKAIELDPNFWPGHAFLGLAYEKTGRFAEAVEELEKARRLDDSPTIYELLGGAYAACGKKEEAKKVLTELTERSSRRYVCPYEVATIYAGLGEKDAAFEWLDKAVEARADCVPWIKPDPKIDPLRSDPRYAALLRRVGLPP